MSVAVGSSFMTPAITANKIYYVEALNTSGCANVARTTVSVILDPPANNATQ